MCGGGLQRNTEKPSRSFQYVLRITPIFKAKTPQKKQYLFPCGTGLFIPQNSLKAYI